MTLSIISIARHVPDPPTLYTGKERDAESGLDYFEARYLNSNLGRFMTPDYADGPTTIPFANLGDPQSLNLYSYVRDDPNNGIDADGHCSGTEGVETSNCIDPTEAGGTAGFVAGAEYWSAAMDAWDNLPSVEQDALEAGGIDPVDWGDLDSRGWGYIAAKMDSYLDSAGWMPIEVVQRGLKAWGGLAGLVAGHSAIRDDRGKHQWEVLGDDNKGGGAKANQHVQDTYGKPRQSQGHENKEWLTPEQYAYLTANAGYFLTHPCPSCGANYKLKHFNSNTFVLICWSKTQRGPLVRLPLRAGCPDTVNRGAVGFRKNLSKLTLSSSEEMIVRRAMIGWRVPLSKLAFLVLPFLALAQKHDRDYLPRLPGAELLVEDYQPNRFVLTTEDRTVTLQSDEIGFSGTPSVSLDGSIIASARRVPGDPSRSPRSELSIYSVKEGKWTDYPEFEGVEGTVAISPDGSKLACATRDKQLRVLDLPHFRLRVLDLKTGKITLITESSNSYIGPGLSWSPDGRRIAFDFEPPNHRLGSEIRAVYVADLETGKISQIGLGQSPSWSPSGEWIAYVGYIEGAERHQDSNSYGGRYFAINDFQISLMSRTGAQSRVLLRFHTEVVPNLKPVWSPDSRTLLVSESRDPDNGTFDIYMVDLASGKTTKRFTNVGPVYAWIDAK